METLKEIHLMVTTNLSRTSVQPIMHLTAQMQIYARVRWNTIGLSPVLICQTVSKVTLKVVNYAVFVQIVCMKRA